MTEGDPCVRGSSDPVHFQARTPLAVGFTAWPCQLYSVKSDGMFLFSPLFASDAILNRRDAQSYVTRSVTGFQKQAGHEYIQILSQTARGGNA